jgi:hypothetical protein
MERMTEIETLQKMINNPRCSCEKIMCDECFYGDKKLCPAKKEIQDRYEKIQMGIYLQDENDLYNVIHKFISEIRRMNERLAEMEEICRKTTEKFQWIKNA